MKPVRHEWLALPVGQSAVIPESIACRHEILQRANQAKRRSGRTYRCTRTDGGTLVERVA